MTEWTYFTGLMLILWVIAFLLRRDLRREMVWMSLFTFPFGFLQPFFVPEYWSPPSLFNLSARTGFDIESPLFCFATGGIAAVLYEEFCGCVHIKAKRFLNKKAHLWAFFPPFLIFFFCVLFTKLNPIYAGTIAMMTGGLTFRFLRPDLKRNIWGGGLLYTAFYFLYFQVFNLVYPGAVEQIWNFSAISGAVILGMPLEEYLFAFAFGMMWSGFYEYTMSYRLVCGSSKK